MPIDFKRGGYPIRHLNGGEIQPNEYVMADGQTIYRGDFVTMNSDGKVQVAGTTGTLLGVAAEYKTGNNQTILVYDDPDIVFGVQASGSIGLTNVGNNANILNTTGNTLTKVSKHELNVATLGTSAAQLRVMGKVNEPDNTWGTYTDVEVLINQHYYRQTTGV